MPVPLTMPAVQTAAVPMVPALATAAISNKNNHSCETIPGKKCKSTTEDADNQDKSSFVPDYKQMTSKKEKTNLPISNTRQTPTLDGIDVKLLATATQGLAHQIMIASTNINQLHNRLGHINAIEWKHDEARPYDINMIRLHGMNPGVAQQTKALHQLISTLTSLTTAKKR